MKHAELFAGYGGLSLAVEAAFGAELAWYAEHDPAPSRIMARHWPDAPNHHDVTQIDWSQVEPVDIISGGSPCQDVSAAGRRAGMTDGTRSNLWVAMREAIAQIKPTYVIWENVKGAHSASAYSAVESEQGLLGNPGSPYLRATGRVAGDLAQLGFSSRWTTISAASVGAPHRRERVFLLAWRPDATTENGHGRRVGRRTSAPRQGRRGRQDSAPRLPSSPPNGTGPAAQVALLPTVTTSDTNGTGAHGTGGADLRTTVATTDFGTYSAAIQRWEQVLGRPAPPPTELSPKGRHRLSAHFTEFMMGLPQGWICDTPGITRRDAIKAAGNGVVPAQATAALTDMLQHLSATKEAA